MAAKSNVPTQTKEAVKRQDKKQTGQRFSELIGDASNVRDASTRMLLLDQDRTVPIVETSKTVRGPQPIPNIPDLTARAGLQPSEGVPFRLGAIGDELTMEVHGCNTVSVGGSSDTGSKRTSSRLARFAYTIQRHAIQGSSARDMVKVSASWSLNGFSVGS